MVKLGASSKPATVKIGGSGGKTSTTPVKTTSAPKTTSTPKATPKAAPAPTPTKSSQSVIDAVRNSISGSVNTSITPDKLADRNAGLKTLTPTPTKQSAPAPVINQAVQKSITSGVT